jgi:hypothetical protein
MSFCIVDFYLCHLVEKYESIYLYISVCDCHFYLCAISVCGCLFYLCHFVDFYCYFNAYDGKMDSSIFEFLYSPFLELTMTEWMFNFESKMLANISLCTGSTVSRNLAREPARFEPS